MAAERPPLSFSKYISLVGPIRHYFPGPGRQQTDCVGTHHGNLTPPRISPSCPHCLIPVSPGAVAGQEYHYQIADEGRTGRSQPQCETARHRLLCGRMGTAQHLPWPSLMRFPAQVVLAHPPASLQPSSQRASRQRTYPAAGYEVFKLYRRYKTSCAWGASRTEAKTRAHEVFAHVGRPGPRAFDFMAMPLKAAHGQICYARA